VYAKLGCGNGGKKRFAAGLACDCNSNCSALARVLNVELQTLLIVTAVVVDEHEHSLCADEILRGDHQVHGPLRTEEKGRAAGAAATRKKIMHKNE